MNDFNTDMRENETGFRPDKYEPRAMRMSFERGQGGASLPNFKETVARLNADSADKQAGQDLLTLGRVADRLNIVQKAQEDILSQKLRALPLPEQVNQLANDFEQSLLDDPNLPYRDNRDSLGGLGRAVYSREMELRRRQFEEGQKPEEQDNPAASFYPRKSVDYIHPENNQPTQSPKPEPRKVTGTVVGLDEDEEPIEPESDEDEEDPFSGTANFNPPGGSSRPPGTPPNPPQPPEDNGTENNPPEEPIIPHENDWRSPTGVGNPYARESAGGLNDLGGAAQQLSEAARAMNPEAKLDLPRDSERQRALVRAILEGIENSNRDCLDYANATIVRRLEVSLADPNMDPSVAAEIRTRLDIHDSAQLIKKAGGYIQRKDPGYTLGTASAEAQQRGHDLKNSTAEVFFSGRDIDLNDSEYEEKHRLDLGERAMPGLPTREAWDWIQKANGDYSSFVKEVDNQRFQATVDSGELVIEPGDVDRVREILTKGRFDRFNFFGDRAEEFIVDQEKNKLHLTSDEQEWLRQRVPEQQMRNFFSTAGTEDFDEDPNLGRIPTNYFTDSDVDRKNAVTRLLIDKLGGDHNAQVALHLADQLTWGSLETSVFNRSALVGNDELAEIIGLKEWRLRRRQQGRARGPAIHEQQIPGFGTSWLRTVRRGSDPENNSRPLFSKDVDINKIKAGSWQGHCGYRMNRYYGLKELLLNREPKPDEITQNALRSAVVYFTEADPPRRGVNPETRRKWVDGELQLRVWWLAGVIDMAASDPNLGWTPENLNELYATVVKDKLSSEVGSFITEAQWRWIVEVTRANERLARTGALNAVKSALGGLFGSGGGGPKKRR